MGIYGHVWNMKQIMRYLNYAYRLIAYYALFPFALWKYRGRDIWLISERGTDARDNGYHFFRYMRENHPEIEACYVIAEESADRAKVAELGRTVSYGTLEHHLLMIAARYKISSHIAGYTPDLYFYWKFARLFPWRGKRIFLQHGIIKEDLQGLYREKTGVDLFICGAKPEYDYVSANFHYDGQVKYTGLARHDALHDVHTKDQILLMPTWRMYLSDCTDREFAASDYAVKWNEVLRDSRLLTALKQAGKTLIFYPHYEVQKKFLHLFSSEDPSVVIADFDHYDVQQLLKESQLLVTDYSSVFFDFAYMKKPCVYYQFDEDQYDAKHYKPGYFKCRTMGFGEVATDLDQLVDAVRSYLENGCQMKEEYAKRAEGFFPLHDKRNCERIFAEIQKLRN